jgi:hypothetical protein
VQVHADPLPFGLERLGQAARAQAQPSSRARASASTMADWRACSAARMA